MDIITTMEEEKQVIQEEKSSLDTLLYYIGVLWKWKWLIFILTATGMVGSVAFSLISLKLPPEKSPLPNYYRANAVLLFQDTGSGMGGITSMLSAFGIEDTGSEAGNMSQIALVVLQSRSFLDKLVEEFRLIEKYKIEEKVKTKSREILINNSEYNFDRNAGILTISFQDADPVFARDLVNREVVLLQAWFEKEGGTMRTEQIQLMEGKMTEVEEKINKLETEIRGFQQQFGVLDISEIAQQQNAAIENLREQLVQVEMEIRNYEEYLKIEDPNLARLRAQRENIIGMIYEIEQGRSGGNLNFPSKDELPEIAATFGRMQMELEIQTGIYQQLSERYEIAKLSAAEENLFKILEWAEIPDEKAGPKRSKICIYTTVFAFLASLAVIIIIKLIKKIKNDPKKTKLLKGEEQ